MRQRLPMLWTGASRALGGTSLATAAVVLALGCSSAQTNPAPSPQAAAGSEAKSQQVMEINGLLPAAAFAAEENEAKRAAALFEEAAKVILHPRCVNCHPAGDQPLQGDPPAPHEPPVYRGSDGFGAVGMRCSTCHHSKNFDPGKIPGAPHWHLAPREMAWEGLSVREVCEQLKDPVRNGDRSLEEIVEHMRQDPLVAWGWSPGTERRAVPGNQRIFGDLVAAWVEAGAACPDSS